MLKHPDYNSETYENDIAILKLEEEAVLGKNIKVAELQKRDLDWRTPVFVVGKNLKRLFDFS